MYEQGEILLFALSAWRETGWSAFKKAFEEVYRRRVTTDGEIEPIQFERARALRVLVALGHCDVDFSGSPRIIVAPPTLASLPQPGLPRAVLCGSRSPTTVKALQQICAESHQALRLTIGTQQSRARYAPRRIELEADSLDLLRRAANALDVSFMQTPPAWLIAEASGSVAEYVEQLDWLSQPEVNWEREDFDPSQLSFAPAQTRAAGEGSRRIRLSRYQNPTQLKWEYWLVQDGRTARMNPDWARYLILADNHQLALLYDEDSGSVMVPRGVPLPAFVARALTLCSGHVPRLMLARDIQCATKERFGFDVYVNVPPDVFLTVARKLGQQNKVPLSIQSAI